MNDSNVYYSAAAIRVLRQAFGVPPPMNVWKKYFTGGLSFLMYRPLPKFKCPPPPTQ